MLNRLLPAMLLISSCAAAPSATARLTPDQPLHGDTLLICEGGPLRVNDAVQASGRSLPRGVAPGDRVGCGQGSGSVERTVSGGNILLVIIDDQGTDYVGAYGENIRPARTPNIDKLASEGLLFRRAYANPVCAPTRAVLLTGQHAYRSGIGYGIRLQQDHDFELDPDAPSIPKTLAENLGDRYAKEALGKWNLSLLRDRPNDHPQRMGFDHYAGALNNTPNYYDWKKNIDGQSAPITRYATTDTTDDAIDRVQNLPEPWFLWVAYHAPHAPWHEPPPNLHHVPFPDNLTNDDERMDAMVNALDTELGRLLAAMPPEQRAHTTILVVGDNGSQTNRLQVPDVGGGKMSVRETGIRVPFIAAGPAVRMPGSETNALVSVVDFLPTIAELAGAPLTASQAAKADGISFVSVLEDPTVPGESAIYTEWFSPLGSGPHTVYDQAVVETRYKLLRRFSGDRLYDLQDRLTEGEDLLLSPLTADAEAAYQRMSATLEQFPSPIEAL